MNVIARLESLTLPTYSIGRPEKNPVFFETRVYQGSKGKVYPVPFVDKVYDHAQPVAYQSALLENRSNIMATPSVVRICASIRSK